MRLLLGIVRLVVLVFMVVVSSSVDQAVGVGAIRLHDRRTHGEQWAEERKQMRSYMTMDYTPVHRRTPKHN
ncbi:uncharacterized protein LOC112269505 [Brachypodium distachyon]|uniref:Secreted protein n=1 Tax=Brachypodium distachyon TaxID=15368 RepID=I1IYY4_BRADI|nr:uncharacterized protein LOC112269505 [Brachypodium distachyon]KQJ83200.1 hypothetical protein BRADI_5g13666v3 [Brachypodium distachyon]|eukprot:XP_024312118.1 uncharacterized protein LOC112269505 [Brachypodium distachyon]